MMKGLKEMKVYTQTGDRGKTSLFSGERVAKSHIRVEAYGDVDELNAVLGALVADMSEETHGEFIEQLQHIQSDLFHIGSHLATAPDSSSAKDLIDIDREIISGLERAIDRMEEELPALTGFILPGGSKTAAGAHIARTVCRRTERHIVGLLDDTDKENATIIAYINRLSDYLFVLSRTCNNIAGIPDIPWNRG